MVNHRFSPRALESPSSKPNPRAAPGIQAGRRSRNQTHHTITQPAYDSGVRKTSVILA